MKKKNIQKKDDKIDDNAAKISNDKTSSITSAIDSNKKINNSSETTHSFGQVTAHVNSFNLDNSSSSNFFDQLPNNMQHQNASIPTNDNMPPANIFFNNQDETRYSNESNLGNDGKYNFQQNYSIGENVSTNTNNQIYNDNKEKGSYFSFFD